MGKFLSLTWSQVLVTSGDWVPLGTTLVNIGITSIIEEDTWLDSTETLLLWTVFSVPAKMSYIFFKYREFHMQAMKTFFFSSSQTLIES